MLAPGPRSCGPSSSTSPEDATVVEVVGQQWNWSLPASRARTACSAPSTRRLVTDRQPVRHRSGRPQGTGRRAGRQPELHLPRRQAVKVLLRSKDVLHDFTVPQFRVKMDMVPGMVTYFWFTPTRPGLRLLCEELCGVAHFAMRGRSWSMDEAAFAGLAGTASRPSRRRTRRAAGDAAAGKATFATCTACHGAQGRGQRGAECAEAGRAGRLVPRRGSCELSSTASRGAHDNDTFGKQMAPMAAMLPTTPRVNNVVAYIGDAARRARAADASRAIASSGHSRLRDLRSLPRRRGAGHLGDQRPAARRHERLVHGHGS